MAIGAERNESHRPRRSLHISTEERRDTLTVHESPAEYSPATPLTGQSVRFRNRSADAALSLLGEMEDGPQDAQYSRAAPRPPLDHRVKVLTLSQASSPPPSAKTPQSAVHFAPAASRPATRLAQLVSPRPPISHSLSDAPLSATPATLAFRSRPSLYERAKPWTLPALWVLTTVGFLVAIAFWKSEVFSGLDHLAIWLRGHGWLGYSILFAMIFITTIPPLPMYSTFIMLAGYCYGTWVGAVISYSAALTGAIVVFLVSRAFFPGAVTRAISASPSFKRVIRAIEKRPKLLFLIRLAPYPYNMMNVLLSSSSVLTFQMYTLCTALSLFKCVIYTAVGGSIRSFAAYHVHGPDTAHSPKTVQQHLGRIWGAVGVVLCVGIFAYLYWLARKAVDEVDGEEREREGLELQEEEGEPFLYRTTGSVLEVDEALPPRHHHVQSAELPRRGRASISLGGE